MGMALSEEGSTSGGGPARVRALEAELEASAPRADERERQMERYASDLNETFRAERRRSDELSDSYVATVRALTNAVEARDAYTGKHAERVAAYGLELARRISPRWPPTPDRVRLPAPRRGQGGHPRQGAAQGRRPDADEEALMRRHPEIGAEIVSHVEFLTTAALTVRHHHERFDGAGYPDGLAGAEIPLAARIFAVADALDAMTTDRPYRPGASFRGGPPRDRRGGRSASSIPRSWRCWTHRRREFDRIRARIG